MENAILEIAAGAGAAALGVFAFLKVRTNEVLKAVASAAGSAALFAVAVAERVGGA